MNIKKKTLSIVMLFLAMSLICLCNKCYAEYYEFDTWGYDEKAKMYYDILDDGTVAVSSYNDEDATTVSIPTMLNGRKVTKVADSFITNNVRLKKVTLPNTIKEIGDYAFYNDISLEEINIPTSVIKIGKSAFDDDKSLKSIELKNVRILGNGAFSGCSELKQINLENVESIGEYAFYDCESLKIVKALSSKLTAIGDDTFLGCTKLEKIYLSNSINVFGESVFDYENNVKIYGFKGSKAEKYAKDENKTFIPIVFSDVFEDNWFYNAVMYNYNNNYIKGTNETHFAPYEKLTRGMIVTILWRMEGSPDNDGKSKFTDVASNAWYAKAVKWAAANKIVSGYTGTTKFGPKDNILRQDLAGILRNYARYKEKNIDITSDLTKFKDYNKISNYAKVSMEWAVGTGVISGNGDGTLVPKGNATRAEAAAMIQKYCNKVGK